MPGHHFSVRSAATLVKRPSPPRVQAFHSAEEAWLWTMAALKARRDGARYTANRGLFSRPCEPDDVIRCLDALYRRRRIELVHARILRVWGERQMVPNPAYATESCDFRLWREALDRLDWPLRVKASSRDIDLGRIFVDRNYHHTLELFHQRPRCVCRGNASRLSQPKGRYQQWWRPFFIRIVLMAFAVRDLSVLAYANGFTLWHYKSGKDTLTAASDTNYFAEASDMMAAGDMVMVSAADGCRMICVAHAGGEKVLTAPLG